MTGTSSPERADRGHAGLLLLHGSFWGSEETDAGVGGRGRAPGGGAARRRRGRGPGVPALGHAAHGPFEALTPDVLLSERGLLQQTVVLHLQPPHVLLNLLDLILQLQPSGADIGPPPRLRQQPGCIIRVGVERTGAPEQQHLSDSCVWSSPGSLLQQEVVLVLDLKLQLCYLTGELKAQSDVTDVQCH